MSATQEDAVTLAETIAAAHKEGAHGKPTYRIVGSTIYLDFAGSDEYPPSSFVIVVSPAAGCSR